MPALRAKSIAKASTSSPNPMVRMPWPKPCAALSQKPSRQPKRPVIGREAITRHRPAPDRDPSGHDGKPCSPPVLLTSFIDESQIGTDEGRSAATAPSVRPTEIHFVLR